MTILAAPTARLAASVNHWWWPATAATISLAWVVVALLDTSRVPPLAAAAAAGTAVLGAAPAVAVAGVPGVTGVLGVFVLPAAVAEAVRGGDAALLAGVAGLLAIAAVVAASRDRGPSTALVMLCLGVTAVVVGLAAGSLDADKVRFVLTDREAGAVVVAGAALVVGAIDDRMYAERAVFAPVLLCAVLAVPALPPLAVALLWGALAIGGGVVGKPPAALAALAIVAAATGEPAAALLFGAGAVLAAALDSSTAAITGMPGAVVLASALASREVTAVNVVAALALAATAALLGAAVRPDVRVDGGRPLALALAIWLAMAPGTWAFTAAEGLRAYDVAAARAVAVGALVALLVAFRRGAEIALPDRPAPADELPDPMASRPVVSGALATAATLAGVIWLVVSVVRLH